MLTAAEYDGMLSLTVKKIWMARACCKPAARPRRLSVGSVRRMTRLAGEQKNEKFSAGCEFFVP